ncbi:MAG TPA: VOC family protein [Thermoanaerobaculia bacterium]|nr:VOC family protein [Thermoanaerobaculia bacterium]
MLDRRWLVACCVALAGGVLTITAARGAGAAGAAEGPAPAAGISRLQSVVLLVADQDKALLWYTEKLGFEKKVDQQFGPGQRWLTVVPKGQSSPEIVLQKAAPGHEGEVGKSLEWVFETADCRKAYAELQGRGVKFAGPPDVQSWGVQARFEDLYGNHFVLISAH